MQVGKDVKLERYCAVELERRKWEVREERLVQQLAELQKADRHDRHRQQGDSNSESGADGESPPTVQTEGDVSVQGNADLALASGGSQKGEQPDKGGVGTVESGPKSQSESPPLLQTGGGYPTSHSTLHSSFQAALLAQQMPPLPKFSGEDRDVAGETFRDWIEQFEMVATVCGWSEPAKLVNLTTRLKGQAFVFYRSCTSQQRTSYSSLVAELSKQFTPVRIQAV